MSDPGFPDKDRATLESLGYRIGTSINSGSYAQVFRATRKGEPCAVKVLNLALIEKNEQQSDYRLKFLPRELYILKKLKHPHLINIYDIYSIAKTWVVIFMELADGGDLLDLLKEKGTWISEYRSRSLFMQFSDGMSLEVIYCQTNTFLCSKKLFDTCTASNSPTVTSNVKTFSLILTEQWLNWLTLVS